MAVAHLKVSAGLVNVRDVNVRFLQFCQPVGRGLMKGSRDFHVFRLDSHYNKTFRLNVVRQDCSSAFFMKGNRQGTSLRAADKSLGQTEGLNSFNSLERISEPLQDLVLAESEAPLTRVSQACEQQETAGHECDATELNQRLSCTPARCVVTDTPKRIAEEEAQQSQDTSLAESLKSSTASFRARQSLDTIWQGINKLEDDLLKSEEESYGSDMYFNDLWEAESKVKRLELELARMQEELDLKDKSCNVAVYEARGLQNRLREAQLQILAAKKIKEAAEARQAEKSLQKEISSLSNQQILDKHLAANEALNYTEELVSRFRATVSQLHNDLTHKNVFEILQKEAKLSSQALLVATQELKYGKIASDTLSSELQRLVNEMEEKSSEIVCLQQQVEDTKKVVEMVSEALTRAEEQVSSLGQKLKIQQEALTKERQASEASRKRVDKLEQALSEEEGKADDLSIEVASLKALVEVKEKMLQDMLEEARRSTALITAATKNTEALRLSEKRVEQLTAQMHILEEQVKSRDLLLEDIKEETFRSTEALKFAAQIKQDLNLSRQREVELTQELASQTAIVMELRQELNENSRAIKAEQALRQTEKSIRDLTAELDILKKGVQTRDEAIKLMKDEMDRNIHILSSAAENREVIRKMQIYINNVESKLKDVNMSQANRDIAMGMDAIENGTEPRKMPKSVAKIWQDIQTDYNLY